MKNDITKFAMFKAGGITALAKTLRISQPSVSKWDKVPASRVLQVEEITGISRHELRPDVFGTEP